MHLCFFLVYKFDIVRCNQGMKSTYFTVKSRDIVPLYHGVWKRMILYYISIILCLYVFVYMNAELLAQTLGAASTMESTMRRGENRISTNRTGDVVRDEVLNICAFCCFCVECSFFFSHSHSRNKFEQPLSCVALFPLKWWVKTLVSGAGTSLPLELMITST